MQPATRWISVLLLTSAAGAGACGGDDGGVTADAGIDAPLGDPSKLVGYFNIELRDDEPPVTSIAGIVNDKVVPEAVAWNQSMLDGDCELLLPDVPFCSTPCNPSTEVCVADDVCEAYAVKQDVGTVSVSGVRTSTGATTFELTSNSNNYLVPGAITLVYPGFAAGDPLTVAATGSAFTPPFTITATGIAPLVVTNPDRDLARNASVELTWTPPASGATSRLHLKLDISHHGGSKGKIECDTADDGALTLSAPMVTQLLDLGAAGFPTIELTRVATGDALTTAGRVDLSVTSAIERPVTVPGIISCDGDEDCTPPATCQSDLTCR